MTHLFPFASGLGAYDKAVVRDEAGEIIGKDLCHMNHTLPLSNDEMTQ